MCLTLTSYLDGKLQRDTAFIKRQVSTKATTMLHTYCRLQMSQLATDSVLARQLLDVPCCSFMCLASIKLQLFSLEALVLRILLTVFFLLTCGCLESNYFSGMCVTFLFTSTDHLSMHIPPPSPSFPR